MIGFHSLVPLVNGGVYENTHSSSKRWKRNESLVI